MQELKANKLRAARATQRLQEVASESGPLSELLTMRVPLPLDAKVLLTGGSVVILRWVSCFTQYKTLGLAWNLLSGAEAPISGIKLKLKLMDTMNTLLLLRSCPIRMLLLQVGPTAPLPLLHD